MHNKLALPRKDIDIALISIIVINKPRPSTDPDNSKFDPKDMDVTASWCTLFEDVSIPVDTSKSPTFPPMSP